MAVSALRSPLPFPARVASNVPPPLPLRLLRADPADEAVELERVAQEGGQVAPGALAALSQAGRATQMPLPRPLIAGERVELWLELHDADTERPRVPADAGDTESAATADAGADGDDGDRESDADWDVRLARVAAITPDAIVLQAGGWQLPDLPGARAVVRRFGADGLAEWEGEIGPQEAPAGLEFGTLAAVHSAPEAAVVVRLQPGAGAGRLFQRRRSSRLNVGLTPVRLSPVGPDVHNAADQNDSDDISFLPVARLTDISTTGAGIVVDAPLSAGTTVSLEFQLPGEQTPFAVRGRVVEPAVPIHGESQPQPDGLPGFRRGIEFVGTTANREARRLASTLARLLPHRSA